MSMASARPPVLTGRRATWFTLINLCLALVLLAGAVANAVNILQTDGSWIMALVVLGLVGFFTWQAWTQFRDRSPVVEVAPDGLRVPAASDAPIAWSNIAIVAPAEGIAALGGRRIDVQVDAQTFSRLRLGQRFMGDFVVRRRGLPNTFSILTQGLDVGPAALHAAIRRYWPPDTGESL